MPENRTIRSVPEPRYVRKAQQDYIGLETQNVNFLQKKLDELINAYKQYAVKRWLISNNKRG